ncbi:MAG: hypothetical protein NC299_08855 [Lachnospiraceae bacterium]|nr:hypothetical protein [Lachnospiraceae bacterium]
MTIVALMDALRTLCLNELKGMTFQAAVQKGDTEEVYKEPHGYLMRLPEVENTEKLAPYFIIQPGKSQHIQKSGDEPRFFVPIRMVFCHYCEDNERGEVELMNIMERIQIRLLKDVTFGGAFMLNVHEPVEIEPYYEELGQYHAGELRCTFVLPAIYREVEGFGKKDGIRKRSLGSFGKPDNFGDADGFGDLGSFG